MYRFVEVSALASLVRFPPDSGVGNTSDVRVMSAMRVMTHVMSSNALHNSSSSILILPGPVAIAASHQESDNITMKIPLGPPRRRESHSSPMSGPPSKRVPSSRTRHWGCSPHHHFCHETRYLVVSVILGANIYFRPFFNHVPTSIGLFLASILPY